MKNQRTHFIPVFLALSPSNPQQESLGSQNRHAKRLTSHDQETRRGCQKKKKKKRPDVHAPDTTYNNLTEQGLLLLFCPFSFFGFCS